MTTTTPQHAGIENSLGSGKLPKWAPWALAAGSLLAGLGIFSFVMLGSDGADFNIVGAVIVGALLYIVLITVISSLVEGRRRGTDRLMTSLVGGAFLVALLPLISLIFTAVVNGSKRFDITFFTSSMRNVVGDDPGGALHAIVGTLLITGSAALIAVPIGLLTSIYLVEYGRGALARGITFFVDVMTGIPSIVAGLFAYALFVIFFGEGVRMGIGGAVALAVLMIPVVVRSSEEILRLVPNELREASLALGVPKWLTVVKVVLPTSIAGITTGVMIAISRVIGETAPLLIIAGFTPNMNYDLTDGRMMTLPVFTYFSYANQGAEAQAYIDRAWAGALTLILIVMVLNLLARLIARVFAPKLGR